MVRAEAINEEVDLERMMEQMCREEIPLVDLTRAFYENEHHVKSAPDEEVDRRNKRFRCYNVLRLAAEIEDRYVNGDNNRRNILHLRSNTEIIKQNRLLRIKYLSGEITEKQWVTKLKMETKKREKNQQIFEIAYMYVNTIRNLGQNVVANVGTYNVNELTTFITQIDELQKYVNNQFHLIRKTFKNKTPIIDRDNFIY